MSLKVALIYNEPEADRYQAMGEGKAIAGVMDEVQAAHQAMAELGCSTILVPLRPPLERVWEILTCIKTDLVFNLFEGFAGSPETEAVVAKILAELKLPFTGCPSEALALALDKVRTSEILDAAGIRTPAFQVLNPDNIAEFNLEYPCIVKPPSEHASHGLSEESVVYDFTALEKQVRKTSTLFGGKALVQEFLEGREFNTTVLGNRRLTVPAVSEITYSLPASSPRILTFAAKWEEDTVYFKGTLTVCPAELENKTRDEIAKIARKAFRLVGCKGYARVDFRMDRKGVPRVLEVNPNPDISPGMGAARQAETGGMSYNQFIQKIISLALENSSHLS